MLCELHPLVHFLETSGLVTFAPEDASDEERRAIYMPFDMLKTAYEEWLKAAHIKSDNKWLPEFYRPPLLAKGCTVGKDKESLPWPRGGEVVVEEFGARPEMMRAVFVYGVELAV